MPSNPTPLMTERDRDQVEICSLEYGDAISSRILATYDECKRLQGVVEQLHKRIREIQADAVMISTQMPRAPGEPYGGGHETP